MCSHLFQNIKTRGSISTEMASNIEVIIGTSEHYLIGYKVETDGENASLHQSFAVHAHKGSVRSVHAKGRYLASGGADAEVYIYDMRSRREIHMLAEHTGTVNHVQFTPDNSHLLTASDDGSLAATRTGSWILEASWRTPHGGKPITYLSIHPSGKLALSLGADLTLRTWNLIKGRQIFTTNLKSRPSFRRGVDAVEWGPAGQFFTVIGGTTIEIWDINSAGVVKEIPCESPPKCVCWLNDEVQLVGLSNGKVLMFALDDDEPTVFQMYETRVKGLAFHQGHLASISSEGDLTIWTVDIEGKKITELCSKQLECRPNCLTILDLTDFANDYELKMEHAAVEEITDVKKQVKKHESHGSRVIVEVEDDEQSSSKKTNKKSKGKLFTKNASKSENNKPKTNKKAGPQNKSISFMEEDLTESPHKAETSKKQNKRKSGFVEENILDDSEQGTNKKKNKKFKNNLNHTFSEFKNTNISRINGKGQKKGRLSLA